MVALRFPRREPVTAVAEAPGETAGDAQVRHDAVMLSGRSVAGEGCFRDERRLRPLVFSSSFLLTQSHSILPTGV